MKKPQNWGFFSGCGGDFRPLHRRTLPASTGQGSAVISMISSKNKAKHDDSIVLFCTVQYLRVRYKGYILKIEFMHNSLITM